MINLIKALQIFAKYKNLQFPTHCEHDVLFVVGITKDEVSKEDQGKLDTLGFMYSDNEDSWISFMYGSA
jgi:hypothetical protein